MFLFQLTITKIFTLVQALVYLYIWAFLRQVYQTKLWKLYLISLSFADLPSLPLIHHYQGCDFPSSTHEYILLQYPEAALLFVNKYFYKQLSRNFRKYTTIEYLTPCGMHLNLILTG